MVEGRGRLDFLQEPLLGRLVAGQLGRQDLDGDLALQPRVLGRVDFAHASCTEFGEDRIRAERGAWAEGHRGLETGRMYPGSCAGNLINKHGYHRRDEELKDAEEALCRCGERT